MKYIKHFYFILMVMVPFSYGIQAFGQEKFELSAGAGLLDFLNIGTRYQLKAEISMYPEGQVLKLKQD